MIRNRLDKKFEAFRFHTITIDGNDFEQIAKAFEEARADEGNANSDHCKDRKRKRRVLYGKCCELAWCCTKR